MMRLIILSDHVKDRLGRISFLIGVAINVAAGNRNKKSSTE
ncbi:MAG: hypothetical protein WCC63_07545 [Candidatus Bathyarchaeia archaeon]